MGIKNIYVSNMLIIIKIYSKNFKHLQVNMSFANNFIRTETINNVLE